MERVETVRKTVACLRLLYMNTDVARCLGTFATVSQMLLHVGICDVFSEFAFNGITDVVKEVVTVRKNTSSCSSIESNTL